MNTPNQTDFFYSPLIKKAMKIAFQAHRDQVDKSGMPYIFHPFHLAEQMETEAEICTALLHDVVEDTPVTLDDLRRAGFPREVLEALSLMTHDKSVPYLDYVVHLRENPVARKVKLADLAHNSTLERLDAVTEEALKRRRKYRIAQAVLADDPFLDDLGLYCKTIPLPGDASLSILHNGKTPARYLLRLGDAATTLPLPEGRALRQYLSPSLSLPEALSDFLAAHPVSDLEAILHRVTGA